MIPKIIHYCWLSDDTYPENLVRCMNTWKEKLPDYEFKLWNFKNLKKNSSKWVSQAFDNKKYAFAADFIRLYAIYNYGGIYLDMDIEVLKSFDDLLNQKVMIAYESDERIGLEAGCFGAEKGNHFIKDCLSYYDDRSFIKSDGSFDIVPLPIIMAGFLSGNPDVIPGDWHLFTNKSYKTGSVITTENSYTVHHFAGSWTSMAQQKYDNLRKKLYLIFPQPLAKIISFFPFIKWQIIDNGFLGFCKKVFRRIF